jgi:hypothetical protein
MSVAVLVCSGVLLFFAAALRVVGRTRCPVCDARKCREFPTMYMGEDIESK